MRGAHAGAPFLILLCMITSNGYRPSRKSMRYLKTARQSPPFKLSARMLVLAFAIGIVRQLWWQYFIALPSPMGLMAIPALLCPFVILLILGCSIVVTVLIISFMQSRSLFPTVTLVLSLFIAFIFPLPPRPPLPQTLHFLEYRQDYETVLEMVRQNSLTPSVLRCGRGVLAPRALRHVSPSCIYVNHDQVRGLVVFFDPLDDWYHPIAFVAFDNVEYPCGRDPFVRQKIDEHWYVCEYEWN